VTSIVTDGRPHETAN